MDVESVPKIERIRELIVEVLSVRENAVSVDLIRATGSGRGPAHGSEERRDYDCRAQPSEGNDGSDSDPGAPSFPVRGPRRLRSTLGFPLRPFSHVPPSRPNPREVVFSLISILFRRSAEKHTPEGQNISGSPDQSVGALTCP
jgi:hypothetical protein